MFHVKHKGGLFAWNRLCGFECKVRHAGRVELTGVGVGGVARRALCDRSTGRSRLNSALYKRNRLVQFLFERVDVDRLGDLLGTCLEYS